MRKSAPIWEVSTRDFGFEAKMARTLGTHPVVVALLRGRGIVTLEDARMFLKPDLDALHSPFDLPDMHIAAQRLATACQNHETVLVHGDYDVDGITATALLVRFLAKCGANVQYFIPHRQINHYGLNIEAIEAGAKAGVTLVIAVDCGVTAIEAADKARELGVDLVIIDHHEPWEQLPHALAIVDPKRCDSTYPERELASVGLAFKTASAVCEVLDMSQSSLQRAFLDLVAMGTITDVVPLIGENRIMTWHGLNNLSRTRKVGLKVLLRQCNVDQVVRSTDIAFRIGPRMNAVGRMGDATGALELMLTESEDEALHLAAQLEQANLERQRQQETTYRQALRLIEEQVDLDNDHVLVLSASGWHIGVVGIVASKLLERHGRPVILLTEINGEARGSARSVAQFDIAEALNSCAGNLIRYGGHALAAGVTLKTELIGVFRRQINEIAAEFLTGTDLQPRIRIDAELLLDELDEELMYGLSRLEPFGQANPSPMFITCGVDILDVRKVGRDENHLKLVVSQGDRPVECIGFGLGHEFDNICRNGSYDLCHTPEINEYNGTRGIQLRLEAIRPANGA